MTSDTRSPNEIEREIEDQRADLTSNLEDLQDKFSIDTVVRQIGDQFREHSGDMGRSISEQVKANPIPLALTGIGLAWMMFGNASKSTSSDHAGRERYNSAEEDFRRSRLEQGRPYVAPNYSAAGTHGEPSWSRAEDDGDEAGFGERLSDGAEAIRDVANKGTSAVSDAAERGIAAMKSGSKTVASAVSDKTSSATASLSDASTSVRDGLATAGRRIAEGTENLSEEGRQRVIAARQKALALRHSAARSAREGADAASDFYDQQPLVVGALALAVGAALGGALPRTKAEDDLMGGHSDNLYAEAERIFEEEKSKVLSVAKSVKDEVKDIAAETKADLDSGAPGRKSAVEAIGDKATAVAGRVVDKAKASADDEDLGKPRT